MQLRSLSLQFLLFLFLFFQSFLAFSLEVAEFSEIEFDKELSLVSPDKFPRDKVLDAKVIVVPGVGGMDAHAIGFHRALKLAGFDAEALEWIRHTFNKALNVGDSEGHRLAINRLVEKIKKLKASEERIVLIGHSTGTYIISKALAEGDVKADLVVLMATGYASEELLQKSVAKSENTLFLYSGRDIAVSLGVTIAGTNDGFHRPALGWKGPKQMMAGLRLFKYDKSWRDYGHNGGHVAFLSPEFVEKFLGQLMLDTIKHAEAR